MINPTNLVLTLQIVQIFLNFCNKLDRFSLGIPKYILVRFNKIFCKYLINTSLLEISRVDFCMEFFIPQCYCTIFI